MTHRIQGKSCINSSRTVQLIASSILIAAITLCPSIPLIGQVNPPQPSTTLTFCSSGCDYNNLQTAIDALPTTTVGKVYVKSGTYSLSSTINLHSDMVLEFATDAYIKVSKGIPLLRGHNVQDVTIINPTITATVEGVKAISFSNSVGIEVQGGSITLLKGGDSSAVSCVDCSNVLINNTNLQTASRLVEIIGTSNKGLCNNIWILNGTFHNSSIEGIKVNYCNNVHVNANTISDTNDNGIDVGYSISEVRGNTITRGGVPHGSGIHTDSARGSEIYENVIIDSGGAGIIVYRASNINIHDNIIENAGIGVPSGNGISIVSDEIPSYNIKVVHNIIQNPSGHAIYISNGQKIESLANDSLFIISGNIIENNLASPVPVGIRATSHFSNVIISNNTIKNTSTGILLEDTIPTAPPKSISVSGNIISGFTNYGIIADYDRAILDGNRIYGTEGVVADRNNSTVWSMSPVRHKVGVALTSDFLKIVNNHIENIDDGIRWIGDSNSCLIQGNTIVSANRYGITDDPTEDFNIRSQELSNNTILDNRSPPKMIRGINFEGLSTNNINIISNKISGFLVGPAINLINGDNQLLPFIDTSVERFNEIDRELPSVNFVFPWE
jgi:hypothetical protein